MGSLAELLSQWRSAPDAEVAEVTVRLCAAIASEPNLELATEVGDRAQRELGQEGAVLVAVAQMYVGCERYGDAQSALVAAGKVAPRDSAVYRWLGEVLLRKGDAERAEKVLQRAAQLGCSDPELQVWLDRAQIFKPLQTRGGPKAVAAEIARSSPPRPVHRAALESISDAPTDVRRARLGDPDPPRSVPIPAAGAKWVRAEDTAESGDGSITRALPTGEERRVAPTFRAPLPPPSPPPPRGAPHAPSFGGLRYEATNSMGPVAATTPTEAGGHVLAGPPRAALDVEDSIAHGPRVARRSSDAPHLGPPAADKPVLPLARDVMDALTLAGVFEPETAAPIPTWDHAEPPNRRAGVFTLVALLLLILASGGGIVSVVKHRRAKQHAVAEALLQRVDMELHAGVPDSIEWLERALEQAFELDSRNPRAALFWARERALRGLLQSPTGIAFEDAIARAKDVGVVDEYLAFARVASFLFQNDTAGAAGLLPKLDATTASQDAWYQLFAGATLERAGDGRSVERYIAAQRLAPALLLAQIALARVVALEGDTARGIELARDFRGRFPQRPEGAALAALAWARAPTRPDPAPPEVADVERNRATLPFTLRAVPEAITALAEMRANRTENARNAMQRGLLASDGPGVASWFGSLALELGDDVLARKAALTAVQFSASYTAARTLAGRVALFGDRLDEALRATDDLDPALPDVGLVRAMVAYERLDADGLARAVGPLSPEARGGATLGGLGVAADVLMGRNLSTLSQRVGEVGASRDLWADRIAVDLALDGGQLEPAQRIVAKWGEVADRPSRAVRAARLARLEEKWDLAETLSAAALRGVPSARALAERVFFLVARNRGGEVPSLLARQTAPAGMTAVWLTTYALASTGKVEDARSRAAGTEAPGRLAPLPIRLIAVASLAQQRDRRRGPELVRDLLAAGVKTPELVEAATMFGLRRRLVVP